MGLSGCMKCLKFLLFAFNFVFWLAGVAILAIGIYLRVDTNTQQVLSSDPEQQALFNVVCYVLMAAGGAIMIVGFCGCCGALQESRMLLTLFAIALFLLLATEIGAGAYAAMNKEKVKTEVDKAAADLWRGASSTNETRLAVNAIQENLDCCGYNNAGDYCKPDAIDLNVNAFDVVEGVITNLFSSLRESIKCGATLITTSEVCPNVESLTQGCRQKILTLLNQNMNIVIGVAIGVAVIELIGVIFSIMLCQAIGQEYTSGKLA